MKIIVDTHILLRAFVYDDVTQGRVAAKLVTETETLIIGRHVLCELAWVLSSRYKFSKTQIADLIRNLRDIKNVVTDRAAIDAGLAAMDAGADFADGVIDYEGRWLGGEMFVSFDKKAVTAIDKQKHQSKLLE